jgi:hypothetical protein
MKLLPAGSSQTSDVRSIPIARSINPVDAVGLTGFSRRKFSPKRLILDAVGRASAAMTSI